MLRVIIIVAALLLVYLALKNRLDKRRSRQGKPDSTATDEMVKCLQCKTYIPRKEAIISGTEIFCCRQHQRDWDKNHQR